MDNRSIKPLLPVTDGMTLRQAVEESIKIWIYMARTGESTKGLHPQHDNVIYMYVAECPLCHYMNLMSNSGCIRCPLYIQTGMDCNAWIAPYALWTRCMTTDMKKRNAAKVTQALFAYYLNEWNETYNPYEDE